jgi:hypothetical protein
MMAQWRQIYRSAGTIIRCPISVNKQFFAILDEENNIEKPRALGILNWQSINCLIGSDYWYFTYLKA